MRGCPRFRLAAALSLCAGAIGVFFTRSAWAQEAVDVVPAASASTPPAAPAPSAAPATAPAEPAKSTLGKVVGALLEHEPFEGRQERRELLPVGEKGGRFEFGSYGRVNVGSDLRGGTGRDPNLVAHGSRLEAASYAELELRREDTWSQLLRTRIVTTVALFPPFFHFSGNVNNMVGVRQLYAQAAYGDAQIWVGSRMYRGDDIYLLNWWPLDNQNTVGGGAGGKIEKTDTFLAAHAGMQRLDNPWQYQQIPSANPYGVGASNVTTLDRPRMIQTLKITQFLRNQKNNKRKFWSDDAVGFKASLYGELHEIGAGVRRDTESNADERLPADFGWLLGAQLTYYTGKRDTYVSAYVRHASGLASYDPLAVPVTFNNQKTTKGASENLIALAGNYEIGPLAVMAAGYLRFVRDPGGSATSYEKYDEGIAVVRPQYYFTEHVGLAVEGSYQARRYAGPQLGTTDGEPLVASMVRGSIMPFFSAAGRGSFRRPVIGAVYTVSGRNAGARSLYPAADPYARRGLEHYLGFTVEWWFNQSAYP